ncbi:MAG TPA: ComEC/Rec2 family competence protein, partial [Bacteroidia bacterium]|nr:ComEC/Rec2 family competence protein [Bacteroidia bacterium]
MVNSQKNPLFPVALAFAAGITLSAFIASPGFWGLIVLVAGSVGMFLLTSKRILPRLQQVSQASLYCCFALAGWVLGENAALIPQNDPMHFIGQEMEVQGHVVDDVRTTAFGHKTILEITQPIQGKVMLYLPLTAKAPQPNDALQGTIHLQALSQKNLGYANWLHHQGIHATAKAASLQKVGEKSGLMAMLHSLRSRVAAQFSATFPNATTAGLSNAMLLGDRTSLDGDIRKDFSATGLSHIVAISGMNFAIIYGVLNLLLYPMLYLRRGRQMRSLIVVPLLAFFALLTGGNPAVVRAAIMLGMLDLSQAFWSKNNSLNALATSALLFLAFDPQSLFTPDFQLSYAAVLGILLLQNPILHYIHLRLPKFPKLIGSALAVTLAAQAATTPLVAWHFHSFPTYFLLANLLVLPLVTLVVQIGFAGFVLAWIPGINTVWGGVMDFLLWAITGMANFMAELPGATISALEPGQTGIWILLAQVLLAFGILER